MKELLIQLEEAEKHLKSAENIIISLEKNNISSRIKSILKNAQDLGMKINAFKLNLLNLLAETALISKNTKFFEDNSDVYYVIKNHSYQRKGIFVDMKQYKKIDITFSSQELIDRAMSDSKIDSIPDFYLLVLKMWKSAMLFVKQNKDQADKIKVLLEKLRILKFEDVI